VNSGTDAIHLALRGLGIGPGHEVITVAHTSVATVAAIEMAGARPVLLDVEPGWWTIDANAVTASITPRTKAVVAVHLYGQPADLTKLVDLCQSRGLFLIEDCAQSHGAQWQGRKLGSFGTAACFSFYPTKNLGGVGDGGMVLTDDAELAARIRRLRQYGWECPQYSAEAGWNSRLGPLQAAVLEVKLPHLEAAIERRRAIASDYTRAFAGLPVRLPAERQGGRHAYHLYVLQMPDSNCREELMAHLSCRGIKAGIHYPVPIHLQPAYAGRVQAASLPHTEKIALTGLSLPVYPELTESQQHRVIKSVLDYFSAS